MWSDKMTTTIPTFTITQREEQGARQFRSEYEEIIQELDTISVFTDGSKTHKGTAVTGAMEECGMTEGGKAFATPTTGSIVEWEICAVFAALRDVDQRFHGRILVFMDCIAGIRCNVKIESEGVSAGLWDTLTPLLNRFSPVHISYIPGHFGISGNKISDTKAKGAVGVPMNARNWDGVILGLSHTMLSRDLHQTQWNHWYWTEGHSSHKCAHTRDRHFSGLSSVTHNSLLRLPRGMNLIDHDSCQEENEHFNLVVCGGMLSSVPPF